jgi:hypothetical protein
MGIERLPVVLPESNQNTFCLDIRLCRKKLGKISRYKRNVFECLSIMYEVRHHQIFPWSLLLDNTVHFQSASLIVSERKACISHLSICCNA